MSTTTLRSSTRVMQFTRIDERTTAIRSGWTRTPNGVVNWLGSAKATARTTAISYYRLLVANGWAISN